MEISNHEIWKNYEQWKNLIEYLINDKIEQIKNNLKNKNSEVMPRTSAISILQQLAEYFLYYEVSFKKSRELLMIYKNIYMIDKETVFYI